MPLQLEKSERNYTKVSRVYTNSSDREEGGDLYSYRIKLPNELQFVTGIELTSYNFPNEISPSFIAENGAFPGTNMVDFYLWDDSSDYSEHFTIEFPQKKYVYSDSFDESNSYVHVLRNLMRDAISTSPVFGDAGSLNLTWNYYVDSTNRTVLGLNTVDNIRWGFTFASGPNSANTAAYAMGFELADYDSDYNDSTTVIYNSITSPNATNLNPYRFVDVSLEEARELNPLARVYVTSDPFYGITQNSVNVSRTRLLSSEPVRILRYLTITITLQGGRPPPINTGALNHDLGFTIFNLANEETVPDWLQQSFVL